MAQQTPLLLLRTQCCHWATTTTYNLVQLRLPGGVLPDTGVILDPSREVLQHQVRVSSMGSRLSYAGQQEAGLRSTINSIPLTACHQKMVALDDVFSRHLATPCVVFVVQVQMCTLPARAWHQLSTWS